MKIFKYVLAILLFLNHTSVLGKSDSTQVEKKYLTIRKLTIEPGTGIKPGPTSPSVGIMFSNLMQWNPAKRIGIVSHTSYTYNNAFLRDFSFIKTNYNYSLSQKVGIGTSIYTRHSSHTLSFMAGINFNNFKETLDNPEFERTEFSVSSFSPDFGLMYNLKIGNEKYFFSYRMYIPLYPYPFKSEDILTIDGNIANLSMEVGFGVRLK